MFKPCPFCGSVNLESGGDDKIVAVRCRDCEATGPNHYGSRAEWNTRSLPTEPQTAPDDGKKEYVRACRKGELCTYGPKGERRREWRLLFEDTDKGPCVFDNETEAIDAWIAASGNWTCTLYATVEVAAPADAERLALDDGALLNRLKTEAQLAKNGGHPILERSFNLAIDEIKKLREAAKGQLVVVNVAIAERQRAERNRDMWKGQCERQAEELTALRAGGWREDMVARPIAEYHEDMGDVLWWKFPITEAPYVGTPNDLGFAVEVSATTAFYGDKKMTQMVGGWPGDHTHFTPIPLPSVPHTDKEG